MDIILLVGFKNITQQSWAIILKQMKSVIKRKKNTTKPPAAFSWFYFFPAIVQISYLTCTDQTNTFSQ